MIFKKRIGERFHQLMYVNKYEPYSRGGSRNPNFNQISGQLLDFKDNKNDAVNHYHRYLETILEESIIIVTVPSHDPEKTESGLKALVKKLAKNNRTDATGCLVRTKKIAKLARGGNRSKDNHKKTIEVKNSHVFKGKDVLLLDDITTTGNSMAACAELLIAAGAKRVQKLALGKTV